MPRSMSRCFACGAGSLQPFYEQRGAPVTTHLLLPSRAEALSYPRTNLKLALCESCGFIQNVLFDPKNLEFPLPPSDRGGTADPASRTLEQLADSLIDRYDLHQKTVLEIGCGHGEFLSLLCQRGGNLGIGIDPACAPVIAPGIDMLPAFYGEEHVQLKADFICSRHTLEHIQPVQSFVDLIRRSLGANREPVLFLEVPDVRRMLVELAFWDVYNEHCSYFSMGSLARLLRRCDFDVFDLRRAHFERYLLLDAVASAGSKEPCWTGEADIGELRLLTRYFGDHQEAKRLQWRRVLKRAHTEGRRTVLWGSGSKAVSFLAALDCSDAVDFVVDARAGRQGRFLPGIGHEVVSPKSLSDIRPNMVIGMNRDYEDAIHRGLAEAGVTADVMFV